MSHVTQVSCIPHTTSSAWAPKAHKQSQLCCLKKSQFCCVKYSRATPCGRELVCEYRPGRPGFKSSLLRREDLGERWSPFFKGKEGDGG